jgi:PTH1 family peptidyl-tRNA hydrolase
MNLSGQSVGEAMRFYKLTPGDVTVFHDELDLAPGKVRVKQGGGHAGHNGLRSIHQHIGEAYGRVRLGIGHPGHKDRVAGYVLSDFAKADADWLDDVLRGVADGAPDLAAGRHRAVPERGVACARPPRATPSRWRPKGPHEPKRARGRDGTALPAETRGPVPVSETEARVRGAFRSQGKAARCSDRPSWAA